MDGKGKAQEEKEVSFVNAFARFRLLVRIKRDLKLFLLNFHLQLREDCRVGREGDSKNSKPQMAWGAKVEAWRIYTTRYLRSTPRAACRST